MLIYAAGRIVFRYTKLRALKLMDEVVFLMAANPQRPMAFSLYSLSGYPSDAKVENGVAPRRPRNTREL